MGKQSRMGIKALELSKLKTYTVLYRQTARKPKKLYLVYVSYPYSENPVGTSEEIQAWAQRIQKRFDDLVLLIPHFIFDAVWNYAEGYTHPEIAVQELELIKRMDIFVYDPKRVSAGVRWEMAYAEHIGVPILTMEELENGKRN